MHRWFASMVINRIRTLAPMGFPFGTVVIEAALPESDDRP